jgi:hypothetical protein
VIGGVHLDAAAFAAAVAEFGDVARAEAGADGDPAERGLQGLEQCFAQLPAGGDGEIGIVRQVGDAVEAGDLRIEEVAHEEGRRQPDAAEVFERRHGAGRAHSSALFAVDA